MKKLVADPEKCTGCGACETACSSAFFKEDNRDKSAIRINPCDTGGYEIAVCDQCGDCMWMCSAMALTRAANGVVRLDKKTCVGCLICIGECLRNYFCYNDDLPAPFKCMACGICTRACPTGTLTIEEGN